MRLEEYLEAIRDCPSGEVERKDSIIRIPRLTFEFGVYDNWPIFLKADFNKVLQDLKENKEIIYTERLISKAGHQYKFNHLLIGVDIRVFNWISDGFTVGSSDEKKKQQESYNMTIMLHPRFITENQVRQMIEPIVMISRYIKEKSIPACFPNSIGWKNLEDYSKIVYYEPRK